MNTLFCKFQSKSNRFKSLLFLIFLIFTLEVQGASKSGGQGESSGGGGDKGGAPIERVHGGKIVFRRAVASPSAVSVASTAVTPPQKRTASSSPTALREAETAVADGEYVVGVIRGIPVGGVTPVPIIPPTGDAGGAAAGVDGAMPADLPLLNIFNAAPPNDFAIPIINLARTPAAVIHGMQLILLNYPDHIDRLGYGNNQIIFRIWVPHGISIGAAFQATIQAALVPPAVPLPQNIYFSGGGDALSQNAAIYFSAAGRRNIARRAYENRYVANYPISLPDNFYPDLRNAATQGRFRYHLLLTEVDFDRFYHTEPKFLYGLLNSGITPRGETFLHNILAISKYPMCGLCTRLLLNCFLNDGEMGRINPAERGGHFNIIIIANDLIGFRDTLADGIRIVNNTILSNNILHQSGVVLDNIVNLRARLEQRLDPHLYNGMNNWFMVLSN